MPTFLKIQLVLINLPFIDLLNYPSQYYFLNYISQVLDSEQWPQQPPPQQDLVSELRRLPPAAAVSVLEPSRQPRRARASHLALLRQRLPVADSRLA